MAEPGASGGLKDKFNKASHFFHKWIMLPSMILAGAAMAYGAAGPNVHAGNIIGGFFTHSVMGFAADILFPGLGSILLAGSNLFGAFDITSGLSDTLHGWGTDLVSDYNGAAAGHAAHTGVSAAADAGASHSAHSVSAGADMAGHDHAAHTMAAPGADLSAQFNQWQKGMSPAEFQQISAEANDIYGMSPQEYFKNNFYKH